MRNSGILYFLLGIYSMMISWYYNHSIFWLIIHWIFWPIYLVYELLTGHLSLVYELLTGHLSHNMWREIPMSYFK